MRTFLELPVFLTEPIALGVVTLPFSIFELVAGFVLPLVGIAAALLLVTVLFRRLIRRFDIKEGTQDRALRWLRRGVRISWLIALLGLSSRLLGAQLARWIATIFRVLNQPFFTSGNTAISAVTLLLVIPVFYFAGWLSRLSRRLLQQNVFGRFNLDPARSFSFLNVTRFVVLGLTIIVGLSVIGIDLSSLAVLFGVLGIGVGFGLQDAVANMFAGLVIIFSRPIKEGDRVLVDDVEGSVQQIKILYTVVNTVTNETILIPNAKITGNPMHNYSYDDVRIVICNTVQVAYSSDLDRVGEVLLDVARRNPWAVPGTEHRYQVWSFDDSGITVRLCTWIANATDRIPAYSWTNLEIWRAFRTAKVEIPFPQVDLHVKNRGDVPDVPTDA